MAALQASNALFSSSTPCSTSYQRQSMVCAALRIAAGALASIVNTLEHGGQIGMAFEMYRNCGGYFKLLEETIESTLNERDTGRRENGELFEMKVALQLGRSLEELRELASKSSSCREEKGNIIEFASKLF